MFQIRTLFDISSILDFRFVTPTHPSPPFLLLTKNVNWNLRRNSVICVCICSELNNFQGGNHLREKFNNSNSFCLPICLQRQKSNRLLGHIVSVASYVCGDKQSKLDFKSFQVTSKNVRLPPQMSGSTDYPLGSYH